MISVRQETPRSYDIITHDGQTYRRNRSHLKKVHNKSVQEPYIDDDELPNSENSMRDNNVESQTARGVETDEQTTTVPVTLRRSQRQIRKPERYRDLNS